MGRDSVGTIRIVFVENIYDKARQFSGNQVIPHHEYCYGITRHGNIKILKGDDCQRPQAEITIALQIGGEFEQIASLLYLIKKLAFILDSKKLIFDTDIQPTKNRIPRDRQFRNRI